MTLPRPLLHAGRILVALLFWPALALVVWGELTPQPQFPEQNQHDKFLHFIAYCGLAAMAAAVLKRRNGVLLAVLILVVLGGMLELIQGVVGRDMSFFDEIANTAGAVTGALGARLIVEPLRRRFG